MPRGGTGRIQSRLAAAGLGSEVLELTLLAGLEVKFGGRIPASDGSLSK